MQDVEFVLCHGVNHVFDGVYVVEVTGDVKELAAPFEAWPVVNGDGRDFGWALVAVGGQ